MCYTSVKQLSLDSNSIRRSAKHTSQLQQPVHHATREGERSIEDQSVEEQRISEDSRGIVSHLTELLSSKPAASESREQAHQQYAATFEPVITKYEDRGAPKERWRKRNVLGTRKSDDADESKIEFRVLDGKPEIAFKEEHTALLQPPYQNLFAEQRRLGHETFRKMRSHVQVLTTPTADTPGTTLLLHFDNKRYLVGSLAEGTQRACVQMGARMLKVSECFITGRTEWRNTGGLIGMILTLADAAASSAAASAEEAKKKALAKAKRLGCLEDEEKMKQLEEEAKKEASARLTLFSAPNLNHTLATARRFVFRKGMPVDVHEINEVTEKLEGEDEWAPYWADENIKVWAMSVLPTSASSTPSANGAAKAVGTVSPRKRSIAEVYEREPIPDGGSTVTASSLTPKERDQLTVKAVVSEMFNSSWRLDTLYETPLSEVRLPASMFIRNAETNKLERYSGPLPGGKQPLPDPNMTVLVRKPWPGALIESLPPTEPAKEAVSYIIRNHTQRGKFHPEQAKALKVEKGIKWAQLSSGNSVLNQDGETVTSEQVLGESKEGGGFAVVDVPEPSYIDGLLARPEWREPKVMAGVGAMVWICGEGVASDDRVHAFMRDFEHLKHVVSSPEYCPNNIALDSAAAATVRLRQVDPARYTVPIHDNETSEGTPELPKNAQRAVRGQMVQLEPSMDVHSKQAIPILSIADTEAETSAEVLEEAKRAQAAVQEVDEGRQKWLGSLPEGARNAELVTLGTGSALPSKYRNVSATLLRVPGWGSMLLDCGENTLGQLRRVFTADELKQILQELRLIWISHMHADHHLGTVGVIKAWYQEVHNSQPLPPGACNKDTFNTQDSLAVVSEPAMQSWLHEYAAVEDYGFSRVAPLYISAAVPAKKIASRLGWFTPPAELGALPSPSARRDKLAQNIVLPFLLNLQDIQAVAVQHCHGARAVSLTFPSTPSTPPNQQQFKVSYSGDCRPSKPFSQIGKGSTVCIHEATFDDELQGDAEAKNHSTTSEALGVAQGMGPKGVVLTHFSQRYQKMPVLEHAGIEGSGKEDAVADVEGDVAMSNTDAGAQEQEQTVEAEGEKEELTDPEDAPSGPLEDVAETFPNQQTSDQGQQVELPSKATKGSSNDLTNKSNVSSTDPHRKSSAPEAVNFKLTSDMKVCVAFDYMRVKVGEIAQMEKFTPALLKLFAEEEKPELEKVEGEDGGSKGGGKKVKQHKGKGKSQRGNV